MVRLISSLFGPYAATAVIWLTYLSLGSLCVGVWRAERLGLLLSQLAGWTLFLFHASVWRMRIEDTVPHTNPTVGRTRVPRQP